LDKTGNILLADQGASRVFRYSSDGKYLGEIGKGPGSEEGHFNQPREVEIDSDGNIFVSDSKGDRPRIQVFNHTGEFLRLFAEKGRGPGQILRSHGIEFDHKQRVFITDVDNMRVSVYDHSGKFLHDFGGGFAYENMNPGEMNAPHGIFVDPSGDVFVNSYYGPTQKYTPDGYVLTAFAHGDPPDGPVYFHSLTGDRWGNVYLLVRSKGGYQGALQRDQGKKISIMKFNNNGDFITGWSFSSPEHSETEAVVDEDGLVYALFVGEKEKGVEIFIEQ
jgi:sugar lactone lactonase YvrE